MTKCHGAVRVAMHTHERCLWASIAGRDLRKWHRTQTVHAPMLPPGTDPAFKSKNTTLETTLVTVAPQCGRGSARGCVPGEGDVRMLTHAHGLANEHNRTSNGAN